jgi:hypothetical protein
LLSNESLSRVVAMYKALGSRPVVVVGTGDGAKVVGGVVVVTVSIAAAGSVTSATVPGSATGAQAERSTPTATTRRMSLVTSPGGQDRSSSILPC